MKSKVIAIIVIGVLLLSFLAYIFINNRSKQEAKQNFILLCEGFVTKIPPSLSELSTAETYSEMNSPKTIIRTALRSYMSGLAPITKYDGAVESLKIIQNANDTFTEYMKYKDVQALIESRNPYRIELEAYNLLLPYAAARSLYDKAYEKSFLERAQKVETNYKDYNSQNFKDRKIMQDIQLRFQNLLNDANDKCAIAKKK